MEKKKEVEDIVDNAALMAILDCYQKLLDIENSPDIKQLRPLGPKIIDGIVWDMIDKGFLSEKWGMEWVEKLNAHLLLENPNWRDSMLRELLRGKINSQGIACESRGIQKNKSLDWLVWTLLMVIERKQRGRFTIVADFLNDKNIWKGCTDHDVRMRFNRIDKSDICLTVSFLERFGEAGIIVWNCVSKVFADRKPDFCIVPLHNINPHK